MSKPKYRDSAKGLDVAYVAQLARIELTAEELARFEAQLPGILDLMRELAAVDVSGVEPTAHGFPLDNVWRADEVRPGLDAETVLANAPATRGPLFSVPPIIE
ncbi:MAG: Asp-tRNA(Asn)/Glu-tRNA(Gln) amidotransferase subunit GatC [Candidatus Marinimicrobia bacterium]|nr:Asp-tRNA(Asn)/Glu-tRNA(Gln) amidotransferase subunit GatC [Candidatus Neomarinimicrobiota bacterium]